MESDLVPTASSSDPKPERIIKKIPGQILPFPKDKEVFMGNLSNKSTADLKELLERQSRILSNKSLVNKLADKGKKATELKARIEHELKSRDEVDKAANLLSEMSLNQLNALEWTGHCNPGHRNNANTGETSSDNEETNPLKILATHSGTTDHTKQLRTLKPEDSLIKPEDLIDSESFSNMSNLKAIKAENSVEADKTKYSNDVNIQQFLKDEGLGGKRESSGSLPSSTQMYPVPDEPEPYAHFICERFGHKEIKERFKPNKPLKPFTGSFPLKPTGRVSSKPKRWEETNVTPPSSVHTDTKLLSLEESIEIQREQNQKLKEVQIRHAAEKLSSLHAFRLAEQIPSNVLSSMAYRGAADDNSDSEHEFNEEELEEQELHDEDQQDRAGTVVYNIES